MDRLERLVAHLLAVAVVLAPVACLADAVRAEDPPPAWEVACGVRLTDSAGLGYEEPGAGAWCWRDHRGEVWTVRTEVLATTARKGADGGGDFAGVVLIEQRRQLGDGWWLGVGTEWTWEDGSSEWSDRITLSAGRSDERPDGHGQALSVRLLGPDSTTYETHGLVLRWESLYPRWVVALEAGQFAFTIQSIAPELEEDREWGRRVAVLFGIRRRATPTWGERP